MKIPRNDASPPRIFKLVDGVVRIVLGGTQTQNPMILICCSLPTLAATVHHLKREIGLYQSENNENDKKKKKYVQKYKKSVLNI